MTNKISSYVGFAKKAKQIIIGTDNILSTNKSKIVLISSDLADNARKKIENKFKVFVLEKDVFDKVVDLSGVKALGIMDGNLSDAIRNLLEVQ